MSDYKENTVGWWLSQLKEPLRSRALADLGNYNSSAPSLAKAVGWLAGWASRNRTSYDFWIGAYCWFMSDWDGLEPNEEMLRGWRMAEECAPGGEEKQPEPPARKSAMQDWFDSLPPAPKAHTGIVGGLIDPKPIARVMTIEMQHEKRIEALEARVKELEGDVTYWKDLCANLHKAWDRSRKMQE